MMCTSSKKLHKSTFSQKKYTIWLVRKAIVIHTFAYANWANRHQMGLASLMSNLVDVIHICLIYTNTNEMKIISEQWLTFQSVPQTKLWIKNITQINYIVYF